MDLKQIRKEKKLTQQESADILGISRRTYQEMEKEGPGNKEQKYEYYCKTLASEGSVGGVGLKSGAFIKRDSRFFTLVVCGKRLEELYNPVAHLNKRSSYKHLLDYVNNNYTGRVCILYGLRRTGKTTMLCQLIGDLDRSQTAYIKIMAGDTMGKLIKDLNLLSEMGIRNILIDEVTLLDDFINSASALSDIYCQMGQKIILSGTDSLGFDFAKREELYDRTITIHTSYISYKEFSYLMGTSDIDAYIEYGGTLQKENMSIDDPSRDDESVSFRGNESTRKYIDTAISTNIQRSLRNDRFGSRLYYLKELYDKGELTNAINRLVENMNHEFLVSVIEEKFISHDLGSARQLLYKRKGNEAQTALDEVDETMVLERLKNIIKVKEKEEAKVKISQDAVDQIKQYLYDLDLLKDVEIRYDDGKIENKAIITQPGMRYSIAKALCYSLMKDSYFSNISETAKKEIIETILSDVKGRMLEDIVLLESSYYKKKDELVFKYIRKKGPGEVDMVIYNREKDSFNMFEIKHSKNMEPSIQCKHLKNKEIEKELCQKYGTLKGKYVLYRGGASGYTDGICYANVKDYLSGHMCIYY